MGSKSQIYYYITADYDNGYAQKSYIGHDCEDTDTCVFFDSEQEAIDLMDQAVRECKGNGRFAVMKGDFGKEPSDDIAIRRAGTY